MPHHKLQRESLLKISPLLLIGILIVLVPVFLFITIDSIKIHNRRTIEQLADKGAALIRSFEAGTRTGVGAMRWGDQALQWLLTETASQPEVEYILIVDRQGRVLAHSNASPAADTYYQLPELPLSADPDVIRYRQISTGNGNDTFEVYKKFTPDHAWARRHKNEPISILPPSDCFEEPPQDWSRLHFFNSGWIQPVEHYIFAGFNMASAGKTRSHYLRHAVKIGIILFTIGGLGIITLFALLAYCSANASFIRVKAFSDEVVANMPVGLITISPDGTISSCNQTGREILGDDFARPHEPTLAACPGPLRDIAEQVMRTNRNITTEVEFIGPDSRSVVLDISASPIREQNGSISGYLMLFKNLTRIKRLEKEMARSKRLAAIGKLAAGVAHEIRNPLSSIKGLATYFKERTGDSPYDRKTAETLINEVDRLNAAVAQLLEFAHPISINTVDIAPREMISHSLRLIANDLAARGIRHRTVITTGKDIIKTDPDRVTQALINLYLNAIQAMNEEGTLTITVADSKTGDDIWISVSDTGRGIAATDLEHIFDPYYTDRNDAAGLGLSIAHKLIESLGGEINVESVLDRGTVFHIRLPVGDREY